MSAATKPQADAANPAQPLQQADEAAALLAQARAALRVWLLALPSDDVERIADAEMLQVSLRAISGIIYELIGDPLVKLGNLDALFAQGLVDITDRALWIALTEEADSLPPVADMRATITLALEYLLGKVAPQPDAGVVPGSTSGLTREADVKTGTAA